MNPKNESPVRFSAFKIYFLFSITALLSACNAVKRVPDNAHLLTENAVYVNEIYTEDAKIDNFILQKPNSTLFGLPLGLHIYNIAKPDPEGDYQNWLEKHPKWHNTFDKVLSQKQTKRLGQSFLISGIHNQLKNIGQAPVIFDPEKAKSSVNYLKSYYRSIGYFNVNISNTAIYDSIKENKKVKVAYEIYTGERYFLDSLRTAIASKEIDSVYQKYSPQTFLKAKNPYLLSDFNSERNRLTDLFRKNGFYNFQPSSINFEIQRDTLLANNDQKLNVTTAIDNLVERDGDIVTTKEYRVHRLKNIRIYTDYEYNTDKSALDSIRYKDITIFYKNKLRYRPRILKMATALQQNDIYSDENRSLTYKQFSNLRIFKYPNIEYSYSPKDTLYRNLEASIYINPLDRFSLRLSSELKRSEIEQIGISLGTSFSARNVFRGAEILELNLQTTFASQPSIGDSRFFNTSEISGDLRFILPSILLPFNTQKFIPYSMNPQTILQTGLSYQTNIGLDKRTISGVLRYVWTPRKNKAIFDLLNVQYVHNLNPLNFFNVYQNTYNQLNGIARGYSVSSDYLDGNGNLTTNFGTYKFIESAFAGHYSLNDDDVRGIFGVMERYNRLTNNDFIVSTAFTYILNNDFQFSQRDFYQFRVKVETAGGLLRTFSTLYGVIDEENEKNKLFGVEYAQYFKTEFDFIKHWPIGRQSTLAFRSFFGLAIPYGNSTSVPFSQSYFAGGSNDNRGWKAYRLGPGAMPSFLDYNEANLKITLNLEYRYPIAGSFKGSIFTDVGNIWKAFDKNSLEIERFKDFSSLRDVGVSSGFGLHYDFSLVLLRLDIGNMMYNPAKEMNQRWFTDISLKNLVFNIGLNYPF